MYAPNLPSVLFMAACIQEHNVLAILPVLQSLQNFTASSSLVLLRPRLKVCIHLHRAHASVYLSTCICVLDLLVKGTVCLTVHVTRTLDMLAAVT